VTWLLKLYPPRWRRRYGAEFIELMKAQPFSAGTVLDVMAGAVDAWLNPQGSTVRHSPDAKGESTMVARMMRLKCAGYGPTVTNSDVRKGVAVTLGGTLLLTLVWVWSVREFERNTYVMAMSPLAYLIPQVLGLRYTSWKGRSVRAQLILMGGLLGAVTAILLGTAWISELN
jgi:hypothetical protein